PPRAKHKPSLCLPPPFTAGRSGVVRRYDPDRLVLDVGRRVAEIRREKGLTQQALATKLKATMQWVQQIEYGANLTLFSLARLANALDVPLDEFLLPPRAGSSVRRPGRPRMLAATPSAIAGEGAGRARLKALAKPSSPRGPNRRG